MKITCVAGARPDFAELRTVIDALGAAGHETELVHTGLRWGEAVSDVFFADLDLRPPDHHLDVGSASRAIRTARVMAAFDAHLETSRPHWVVVVGDSNAAMACAVVAARAGCRVAHVDAGRRGGDGPVTAAVNRIAIDRASDLLLARSPEAVNQLRFEGFGEHQVHLVGNPTADTVQANLARARRRPIHAEFGVEHKEYCVLALPGPTTTSDPALVRSYLDAVGRVAARLPVVVPAHRRAVGLVPAVGADRNLLVVETPGHLDGLALHDGARLVMTDSGLVEDETTALGVPCLTLRDTTERPITITEGTNRLVGTDSDAIVAAALEVIDRGVLARTPALWDGKAGLRIADAIDGFDAAIDGVAERRGLERAHRALDLACGGYISERLPPVEPTSSLSPSR